MKKQVRIRIMSILMAFLMVCTSIWVTPVDVQAKVKKVTQITVSANSKSLYVGDEFTLNVKRVKPVNASKDVTYKSSNNKVVTVNKKGQVVAKKRGEATIWITSKVNKKVKANCKITVKQQVEEIQVTNIENNMVSVRKGKTCNLKTRITPANADNKKINYITSNSKVATVSEKGKITAKGYGTAKVTIQSKDKKAKTVVIVKVPKKPVTQVTNISLASSSVELVEGDKKELGVNIKPDNATNKEIIWTSSNTGVATVTNGLVQAVKMGTATITATAADGSGVMAESIINVKKKQDVIPNSSTSPSNTSGPNTNQDYKLVWEDNFNGTQLNQEDWNYEYHDPGWVNSELQKYTDSPDNIYVKDGKLVIQAIKTEDQTGTHYTSGRINTQNKHDYKYGKFEVRAKVPSGKGFLPAFWMMPTDENLYGQWPKCGEIDIMEVLGDQTNKAFGTLHFGEPHTQSQGSYILNDGDFASEYHNYSCEWEPNEIRFYVDGKLFYTESDWFSKRTGYGEVTYPAPYDQPFYLILNLAVGGNWPGNPDNTTEFGDNAALCVDYVKVYQKDSYNENVTKPVKNLVFRDPDSTGNYIINGDFSEMERLDDQDNWQLLLAGGGAATAEIATNAIHISTDNAGSLDYSVQLVEPKLPMVQGYKYQLSFDAYASANRTMITDISAPDKGYKRYLADTSVALTTEKKTYRYEFDMTDSGDVNGRLEFNLGNQGSTDQVHISNVRLEKIGDVEIIQDAKQVLPDGNYVYNGEFQQGSNRMDYWSVDTLVQGTVASVTNLENMRELKITMPKDVTSLSQVIVKQEQIPITGNKAYTLSFDAYADGNKSMQSEIAGQTFESQLTSIKTTYRYTLQTDPSLNGSVLRFLLGQEGTIYIDNVRIQENSLLINGDFSNGLTGYEVYAYNPSDISYVVDELNEQKAACIDIKNTGDADWKIQLKQNSITLENGKWYRISMDAKSTLNRKIMYALQKDGSSDNDWTPYSGSQVIDLTNAYQTFTHEFQMTGQTDKKTILSISMGAVGGIQIGDQHTVILDNIKLEEIEKPQDTEIVAGTELIKNGDFTEQENNWINAVTAPGAATADFTQGKAVYTITNPGTDDWNVQLKQDALSLEQGASYEIKFKIKSSVPRTIKYALLNPLKGYTWYGGLDVVLEDDQQKEITQTITVTEQSANTIEFVISMGKINGVDTEASIVEISDVSIIKK